MSDGAHYVPQAHPQAKPDLVYIHIGPSKLRTALARFNQVVFHYFNLTPICPRDHNLPRHIDRRRAVATVAAVQIEARFMKSKHGDAHTGPVLLYGISLCNPSDVFHKKPCRVRTREEPGGRLRAIRRIKDMVSPYKYQVQVGLHAFAAIEKMEESGTVIETRETRVEYARSKLLIILEKQAPSWLKAWNDCTVVPRYIMRQREKREVTF